MLAFLCATNAEAQAQSFDCSKASTAVELAICEDNSLRRLDSSLAQELKSALSAAPERRQALLSEQRQWLTYRDKHCRDETPLAWCLASLYYARVAHLQAWAAPAATTCLQLADRYRPLANSRPGEAPIDVLGGVQPALLAYESSLPSFGNPVAELPEWAKEQKPPFVIGQELMDALTDLSDGTIGHLGKLPGAELYSITHEQGSGHCYASQYFTVEGGHARPLKEPPLIEEGGASCQARRGYGRVNGVPALIQEKYDHTPSMWTTTMVVTWDGELSPSTCAITFLYAPMFGKATWHNAKESCDGPLCDGLRAAARELVEAAQKKPGRLRDRLEEGLTPAQRAEYDAAVRQAILNRGLVSDVQERLAEGPEDLTSGVPLFLPYVYEGKVYVASLGHFAAYGNTFADWSVEFESFMNGERAQLAVFAVGMTRGALENVSIQTK